MAKKYDAAAVTAKQIRRAQAATQDYQAGVSGVTESPTAAAAKKKDKLKAGFNAAVDSGKWEAGLASVSLDDWKAMTLKKGGERYATGVADSQQKTQDFHEQFSAFLAQHMSTIDAMPDTTQEQRLAKMMANARGIANFKRVRRRR